MSEFNELEIQLKDNFYNMVLKPKLKEIWDDYSNPEYYHVLTIGLAKKMGELRLLNNEADSIGRYAYISNFGEPIPLDFIMGLEFDERTTNSGTFHDADYAINIETLAGYESLIKDGHFSGLLDKGGINNGTFIDIVIYTTLCELEKQNMANKLTKGKPLKNIKQA